ncbi:unnamed protein product, partial [Allacma fusca]
IVTVVVFIEDDVPRELSDFGGNDVRHSFSACDDAVFRE